MSRNGRTAAVTVLACLVAGFGLAGCDEAAESSEASSDKASNAAEASQDMTSATGTRKVDVDGKSVNVSCSGERADGEPVVILLHGGGDSLERLAGIQKTLGEKGRACSYDRLGAGASDKPDGPQTFETTGKILTGVIDQVAGDAPVVLAGHSLGGLISARYAPEHQDRVKGLVLLDATSPNQMADLEEQVPESATGPAAQLRDQTLAILGGQGPEKISTPDGPVSSAGDIPVEVIKHGQPYLAAVPKYGEGLEKAWDEGQRKWLELSRNSNLSVADKSDHYIYEKQPELTVRAIQRVADDAVR